MFCSAAIYSIQWHVKVHRSGRGYNVSRLFALHNACLSFGSLLLLLLALRELRGRLSEPAENPPSNPTASFVFCERSDSPHTRSSAGGSNGSYYFVSYLYYLSKFAELGDTVYLALKGKLAGWGGLQVWHHSAVMIMGWGWLRYSQSLQHVGILANTAVHVIMYAYFSLTSLGFRPKWRRLITLSQIAQFVLSFLCVMPNLWMHFSSTSAGSDAGSSSSSSSAASFFSSSVSAWLAGGGGCAGQGFLLLNSVFNATLLVEFTSLFKKPHKHDGNSSESGSSSKQGVDKKQE